MARRATTALSHRQVRFTAQRRSGLGRFPPPAPTASQKPYGLEHRFFKLCLRQKILEQGAFLLQLGQPLGLLGLHPAVLLLPAVAGRLGHLNGPAGIGDGLALGDQLLHGSLLRRSLGLQLADDLIGGMADSFHDGSPCSVQPDDDSHSAPNRLPGSTPAGHHEPKGFQYLCDGITKSP